MGERLYWRCPQCEATLMDASAWLSPQQERAVYEWHDNRPDDPRYRAFLGKLVTPLLARLPPGDSRGLDFGCGPGPVLGQLLEQHGVSMARYDPAFFPDTRVLARQYDVITCTEVIEHLHAPAQIFARLDQCLAPGGVLAIMTCFQTDDRRFERWHYRRDPTHVVFYREATLAWVAAWRGWQLEIPVKDVALFHKPLALALK
ncbi:class I SAM-dependent methyltransferase [Marinobacter sp. X15-166B]|uniref:class I SAM-dependent methyltransferase n=1 Tax=Marinobacter sp. X15-166B TaxID=1897620 RepID=UPI001D17B30F|nr:class I SAM-dependent methyltransferase [Marinobacter sp. X15-166B]